MSTLITARLNLLPLTRAMMTRRLETDSFSLRCELSSGVAKVTFSPSWPGDALVLFRRKLDKLKPGLDEAAGSFAAVLLGTAAAVGQLGVKGIPNEIGEQEIGYGFNPEVWGRGIATEAVMALTTHLLDQPGIRAVTAETAVTNIASARVLEKAGFAQTGTNWDEDDGDLITWKREAEPAR